jgi:Fur family transcriptional regulator, ferric uptake regulator
MPADLHVTIAAELRKEGQRYTRIRRRLVEILSEARRPLTIPEILGRGRGLAQSSIYRNLAVLARAGVAHRVLTSDEHARYELTEDLAGHHHHLICAECGRVEDFVTPTRVEQLLDRAMTEVASGTGFSPTQHRLDLVGRCARCG